MRFFCLIFLFSFSALAAKIQSVKNNKVLIELEGRKVETGQSFYVLDASGKKRSIVKIRQIKGDRAVAEITKGRAQTGYSLSGEAIVAHSRKSRQRFTENSTEYNGTSMGVLGGVLQNTMSASFTAASTGAKTTVDMKGMGFGALGFYDYAFSPELQLRGAAGIENYTASGTTSANDCDSSTTCDVKIMYLSLYGGIKYNVYMTSSLRLWVGGFYGYLLALSKASSVLRTDDLSSNQIYGPNAGLDYALDSHSFIPVTIDYGLFPDSPTVKASSLIIRAGWGMNF